MKPLRLWMLWFLLLGAPAWSQGGADLAHDRTEAERARIEGLRRQKTVELDVEEAACVSKFAVTDCQNKVTVRRRQMLADLKRQEAALNTVQRQQKGLEQQQRGAEKAVERAQRQAQAQVMAEKAMQEDRQKTQDEKVRAHQQQAIPVGSKASASKSTSMLDPKDIARNREAYLEKQKALEKRRKDRDQRLLDHGAGARPLPVAP